MCSVEGCEKSVKARGWCSGHYQRWKKHGDPGGPLRVPAGACSIEWCEEPAHARGWCNMHYLRWWINGDPLAVKQAQLQGTPAERFWPKVNKNGPTPQHRPDLGPCWLWTCPPRASGYGGFEVDGQALPAHRVAYELSAGPIPEGLTLDHLCHNGSGCELGSDCPHRCCVNPAHLEAVTNRVNVLRGSSLAAINARKTHCIHGHPFDAANTYLYGGYRACRECRSIRNRERKQRARAARRRQAAGHR